MLLQKAKIPAGKINPGIRYQKLNREHNYKVTEREVNSKIRKISFMINDQYPELSKYLEKMPGNTPVDNKTEITLKGLSTYYDSLNVLLNFHIKEHPVHSTL